MSKYSEFTCEQCACWESLRWGSTGVDRVGECQFNPPPYAEPPEHPIAALDAYNKKVETWSFDKCYRGWQATMSIKPHN